MTRHEFFRDTEYCRKQHKGALYDRQGMTLAEPEKGGEPNLPKKISAL
jgi:hypothetical protein